MAGGRLADLHAAPRVSAETYVEDVAAGRRSDAVLSSQLRAGFELRGVPPGYLEDWRSRDYGSLLVLTNDAARSDSRPRAPSALTPAIARR